MFLVDPDGDVGEDAAVLGEVEVPQALLHLLLGAPGLWMDKFCVIKIAPPTQGVPCPRRLGFVDLDLGCSTTLLGQ